ncbi:MAG: hypothetical protein B7Z80_26310 [Rhodospirillales bacterium 20-64-7]|nr:MAG: hypothetical protein B7Z80_26310 [Rhodospirillales bacterium 20-64-7]HQT78934.1 hypothetical protein [Rhodopila sp.]
MKLLVLAAMLLSCSTAMADELPLPPIPPAHPPEADGAPVPNPDAERPLLVTAAKPSVDVRIYRAHLYDPSMGFAPGSRYQPMEDRKGIQPPGLSVTVPLK